MKVTLANHTKTILKPLEEIASEFSLEITELHNQPVAEVLNTGVPALVIINWVDSMNEEICSAIKRIKSMKSHPYILLIGTKDNVKDLAEGISSGADDYIMIPFTKDELKLKFNIVKKHIDLNNTMLKTKKKLIRFAKEDPVTSVLNRRALLDEILNEMGRASRRGDFTCSIMINLHNYDDLLTEFGTRVFDAFLGEFASRLKKSIRPYDKIGRFEISRFVIFLPHARNEDAEKVAERIIKNLQSKKFRYKDDYISPCVSIGISELDPDDVEKNGQPDDHLMNDLILESFIRRSEFATTTACEKGDNKIEIYTF
jgi:diguanylate cyclase (GGDEF)-like protein